MQLRTLCVFCGSSQGSDPSYARTAEQVGATLARRDIRLVYGGGNVGLMGLLADAAMQGGGNVVGVIPRALADKELAHQSITELHVVESMHARKALMSELADGFVALPGGFGTFEEFCEVVTWCQLGLLAKPCGLLNVDDYYRGLLEQFDRGVRAGFIKPQHRAVVLASQQFDELLRQMTHFEPPPVEKWISPPQA